MSMNYSDWTTDDLLEYEEWLYDIEVEGDSEAWFTRDQVLWELNSRNFGDALGQAAS
jgi:hypothetical protein